MKKEIYVMQEGSYWQVVQEAAQDSIVQVCAQIGAYNWLTPYQVTEQYENKGSGFFIDEKGHFITNMHVVEDAKHIWIHVPCLGQVPLEANIVGVCPDRDLALLKVTDDALNQIIQVLEKIPALTLGDSDSLERTESVLALGYPLGKYNLKATTGVISGRHIGGGYSLIQITAPVNPGSSGGPLLNVKGEVIGIAIAMVPKAQNVGYVIPVNELKIILSDLYINHFIRKAFLGVRFVNSSDEKMEFFSIPQISGLYVARVYPGSLFDHLGVKKGDIINSFNGYVLDAYGETDVQWSYDKVPLYDIVSRMKVNDSIEIELYRDSKKKIITGKLELYNPFAIDKRFPGYEDIPYEMIAGLVVMELAENHLPYLLQYAPELARFTVPENKLSTVLVVTNVLPGSYAYKIGTITVGDVLITLNGEPVGTIEQWRQSLLKSIETGFMVLETDQNILSVFSLKKIAEQERFLSKAFTYPITHFTQKIIT